MPIALKKFRDAWLEKELDDVRLNEWLERTEDEYTAKCTLCDEEFDISGTGFGQVKSHHRGEEHSSKFNARFKNENSFLHAYVEGFDGVSYDDLAHEQKVARAERIWCQYVIDNNWPFQDAIECAELFKHMFPDCLVAVDMKVTMEMLEEVKRESEKENVFRGPVSGRKRRRQM